MASTFLDCRSQGQGGALSAVGATVSITASSFKNCTAIEGGGALAATGFTCYGTAEPFNTSVTIADSKFDSCSSYGSGGAVFVESSSVKLTAASSRFIGCRSAAMGGALAAVDGGTVKITESFFSSNSASGFGGGAFYAQYAQLTLHGVSANDNIAAAGGGGVLYWRGIYPPLFISWCTAGTYPDPAFECSPSNCAGTCLPCDKGTYYTGLGAESKASCALCSPGTFGSMMGSSSCTSCGPGTFSTAVGPIRANTCLLCAAGSYSETKGSSVCLICDEGTFATMEGSTSCQSCFAGSYLSSTGATDPNNCTVCPAGAFSGSAASSSCDPCDIGMFSASNASSCSICAAGTFSSAAGSLSCRECGPGTYSLEQATACIACTPGTYFSGNGGNDSSSCVRCREGFVSGFRASGCDPAASFRRGKTLDFYSSGETQHEVVLPFAFPFYCEEYLHTNVSVYGVVEFDQSSLGSMNYLIPSNIADHVFIAPFWQELAPPASNGFIQWSDNDTVTFQWTNWATVSYAGTGGALTFQVSLLRNGTILISYLELEGLMSDGQRAVVGIYPGHDDSGVILYDHDHSLYTGLCIRIFPSAGQCSSYVVEQYQCEETSRIVPVCEPGQYLGPDFQCTDCPSGTFQTGYGMISIEDCKSCSAGTYLNTTLAAVAVNCTIARKTISDSKQNSAENTRSSYFKKRVTGVIVQDNCCVQDLGKASSFRRYSHLWD